MRDSDHRRPAFTDRVLNGLLLATCEMLAGEMDGLTAKERRSVEDADQWLRRMREWKAAKRKETQ